MHTVLQACERGISSGARPVRRGVWRNWASASRRNGSFINQMGTLWRYLFIARNGRAGGNRTSLASLSSVRCGGVAGIQAGTCANAHVSGGAGWDDYRHPRCAMTERR